MSCPACEFSTDSRKKFLKAWIVLRDVGGSSILNPYRLTVILRPLSSPRQKTGEVFEPSTQLKGDQVWPAHVSDGFGVRRDTFQGPECRDLQVV